MLNATIVRIESDLGAGTKGAKLGPEKTLDLLKETSIGKLPQKIISYQASANTVHTPFAKNIDEIVKIQQQAVDAIEEVLQNNQLPIVISGDHSNGNAVIAAIKNSNPDKTIGVVWIDAHADLHSPFTTPSGNVHGMPLAASLGSDNIKLKSNQPSKAEIDSWKKLEYLGSKQICPKLLPENLVFIGLRDYETPEIELINSLGIKYFGPEEIVASGIKTVANQSIEHLKNCDLILVSFDVDALDPEVSHGTGTPVPGGISFTEAVELLSVFMQLKNLASLEVTEINPLLDRQNPMENVAAKLLAEIFKDLLKN